MRHLIIETQSWPIAGSFRIAHGSLTNIDVVNVTIRQEEYIGDGECRPYARYNETPASVMAQIKTIEPQIKAGLTSQALQYALPAGAARNAVDCALWDLKAKQSGNSVAKMLRLPQPSARQTAFTLSIDSPRNMAKAAKAARSYAILKIKIADMSGLDCALAILQARPDAQLIIDANEALTPDGLTRLRAELSGLPILMIEQPLPASLALSHPQDPHMLPILCADESLHTRQDLPALWQAGYRAVNVKLDKCGGVTEGLALMKAAKSQGFVIMAGCMVGTSLAMAPMLHLAHFADVIDLDGPALLAKDCAHGLSYKNGWVSAPDEALWGV